MKNNIREVYVYTDKNSHKLHQGLQLNADKGSLILWRKLLFMFNSKMKLEDQ